MEELKKLISSILVSSPSAMTITNLDNDYCEQIGQRIPYRNFGFNSLIDFLNSMPDVVEVQGSGMSAIVKVKVSNKVAHIDKLISHQKSNKSTRRPKFGSRPQRRTVSRHRSSYNNRPQHFNTPSFSENLHPSIYSSHQSSLPPRLSHSLHQQRNQIYIPPRLRPAVQSMPTTSMHSSYQPLIPPLLPNFRPPQRQQQYHLPTLQPIVQSPPTAKSNPFQSQLSPSGKDVSSFSSLDLSASTGAILKAVDTSRYSSSESLYESDSVSIDSEEDEINYHIPRAIQENLQKLIKEHNKGIWCGQLPEIYKKMFKKELDYAEYGYRALSLMCSDLKYIFHIIRPDKGDHVLFDKSLPLPTDLDPKFTRENSVASSYKEEVVCTEPALADISSLLNTTKSEVYPKGVMQFGDVIPRQFLPENVSEDEYIDVVVGEVYDPSKFWLLLNNNSSELDNLMDDIQTYYAANETELEIPKHMLKVDLYCAAKYNNEYHRSMIVTVLSPDNGPKVKVFYIDYGTVSSISAKGICYLHKSFATFPAQAIRARLANIYPPNENMQWSVEASSRFLQLVTMKSLVAHVYRINEKSQIINVFLADTTTDEDIYMNDTLVKEGLAKFTNQKQESVPLDRHYFPTVQYLHLYPTFEELETGFAPSAADTISLLKRGCILPQIYSKYFMTVETSVDEVAIEHQLEKNANPEPQSQNSDSTELATPVDDVSPEKLQSEFESHNCGSPELATPVDDVSPEKLQSEFESHNCDTDTEIATSLAKISIHAPENIDWTDLCSKESAIGEKHVAEQCNSSISRSSKSSYNSSSIASPSLTSPSVATLDQETLTPKIVRPPPGFERVGLNSQFNVGVGYEKTAATNTRSCMNNAVPLLVNEQNATTSPLEKLSMQAVLYQQQQACSYLHQQSNPMLNQGLQQQTNLTNQGQNELINQQYQLLSQQQQNALLINQQLMNWQESLNEANSVLAMNQRSTMQHGTSYSEQLLQQKQQLINQQRYINEQRSALAMNQQSVLQQRTLYNEQLLQHNQQVMNQQRYLSQQSTLQQNADKVMEMCNNFGGTMKQIRQYIYNLILTGYRDLLIFLESLLTLTISKDSKEVLLVQLIIASSSTEYSDTHKKSINQLLLTINEWYIVQLYLKSREIVRFNDPIETSAFVEDSAFSVNIPSGHTVHVGDVSSTVELPNREHVMPRRLVVQTDLNNVPIHVIRWQDNVYVSIHDILQFTTCKDTDCFRIRTQVMMKDVSASSSITHIRLTHHKELQEELIKHNIFDKELHVAPVASIPRIVKSLGSKDEYLHNYKDFLKKVDINSSLWLTL